MLILSVMPVVLIFTVGSKFLPYSKDTLTQGARRMTMFADSNDSAIKRRYGEAPTIKSEVDRMTNSYAPSLRSKLDAFVMRTADKFLGKDRKAPERNLYLTLQDENDKNVKQ